MEKYLEYLKSSGAESAKIIDPKTIVTAPWTHYKCHFGCGYYGKKWSCPPRTPNYKETQEIIDCFKTAILFRCEDRKSVTGISVQCAREAFLDGYYKVIAFGEGPCKLCKECNPAGCNFPQKMVPAMEACGIDVFQTVRNNGYVINTVRNKEDEQNYFGLILME